MKIISLAYILFSIFSIGVLTAQEQIEKFPGGSNVSKSFFFDSIIPVWVPPTKGYYEETCEKVWDRCEKKYVYKNRERWVEGDPGYYKNEATLFLSKNGKIIYATEEVLAYELKNEITTVRDINKIENKNGVATLGGLTFLVGLGMIALPASIDDADALGIMSDKYIVTSLSLMVVGGVIALAATKSSEYDRDVAIKKYNKSNMNTKSTWSLRPSTLLIDNKLNAAFKMKFKF